MIVSISILQLDDGDPAKAALLPHHAGGGATVFQLLRTSPRPGKLAGKARGDR
jgi:hypothetical protein